MEGLIGKKIGMTRIFGKNGESLPVTVVEAGPCHVVQVKTVEKEGYSAIQLGYGEVRVKYRKEVVNGREVKKQTTPTKPVRGHFDKAKTPYLKTLKEFKVEDASAYEVGQQLDASMFGEGERVDIIGTSKGKGFQGVIKRHNFRRGRETHGGMSHRAPGSIGCSAYPSEVFKGKKMGGHMGNARCTVKNLEIVGVDSEKNLLLIKGALPGAVNSLVMIRRRLDGVRS